MSKVYVTQEVPSVDYTAATEFGDLVFVTGFNDRLSSHPSSLNNATVLADIEDRLRGFGPNDYLVCTGAPAHMALCGAVLGDRLKQLLVWDNREMRYFTINRKGMQ